MYTEFSQWGEWQELGNPERVSPNLNCDPASPVNCNLTQSFKLSTSWSWKIGGNLGQDIKPLKTAMRRSHGWTKSAEISSTMTCETEPGEITWVMFQPRYTVIHGYAKKYKMQRECAWFRCQEKKLYFAEGQVTVMDVVKDSDGRLDGRAYCVTRS